MGNHYSTDGWVKPCRSTPATTKYDYVEPAWPAKLFSDRSMSSKASSSSLCRCHALVLEMRGCGCVIVKYEPRATSFYEAEVVHRECRFRGVTIHRAHSASGLDLNMLISCIIRSLSYSSTRFMHRANTSSHRVQM